MLSSHHFPVNPFKCMISKEMVYVKAPSLLQARAGLFKRFLRLPEPTRFMPVSRRNSILYDGPRKLRRWRPVS